MAAELEPHGGEQAVLEVRFASRGEALEERGREHVSGHRLVDRRVERPAPLARVRHAPGEALERRVGRERRRGQVEEPRGYHAAPAPDLGDRAELQYYLVVLRTAVT